MAAESSSDLLESELVPVSLPLSLLLPLLLPLLLSDERRLRFRWLLFLECPCLDERLALCLCLCFDLRDLLCLWRLELDDFFFFAFLLCRDLLWMRFLDASPCLPPPALARRHPHPLDVTLPDPSAQGAQLPTPAAAASS